MDAQNSDVLFPGSPSAPTGAAALAPKKPATATPKPAPQPPAPSPTDNSQDVVALGKEAAAAHEKTARAMGQFNAESMQLKPPELVKPEKFEPKKEPVIQEWARAAIIFAALGGHGSRQALTASLNAAAAGLKGLQEGNKEEYDRQFKTWERETENASRLISFQQNAYKIALGKLANSAEAAKMEGTEYEAAVNAKMKALAIAQGDEPMAQAKTAKEKLDLYNKRDAYEKTLTERKIEASAGGQKLYNRNQAEAEIKAFKESDEGKTATPTEVAEHALTVMEKYGLVEHGKGGQQLPPLTQAQQDAQIERWRNYEDPPYNPNSRVSTQPGRREAWDKLYAVDPNYDSKLYAEANTALKSIAPGGKDGQILQSMEKVIRHTETMEQAAKELQQTSDVGVINKIHNWLGAEFGQSGPTNFDFVKKIYVDELSKSIAGASGGSSRDREQYENSLRRELSNEQLFGSEGKPGLFDKANELLAGRYNEMRETYGRSLPPRLVDRFFPPEVAAKIESNANKHKVEGDKPVTPKSYGEARKLPVGTTIMLQGEPHKITGEEDWYKWKGQ